MQKFTLALILAVAPVSLVHAAPMDIRALTVQTLHEYAQKVYDRRDYAQAGQVYERILAYDPQNTQAVQNLRVMAAKGEIAYLPQAAKARPVPSPAPAPVRKVNVVKPKPVVQAVPVAPVNESVAQEVLVLLPRPVVVDPSAEILDQDLAALQQNLDNLRIALKTKQEQIKALEQQLQ